MPPATIPFIHAGCFESEVSQLERRAGLEKSILFYGSSSIRLWNTLQQDFPGVPILNHGFGGSELAEAVPLFERLVTPYEPQALVIYAGDNDIEHGHTPQGVAASLRAIIQKTRDQLGMIPVVFISIKPSPARSWLLDKIIGANRLCRKEMQSGENLYFVDIEPEFMNPDGRARVELFVEDGLHMNAAGYRIWTQKLRAQLPQLFVT